MTEPAEPAVVEWGGGERRGLLDRLAEARGWHPGIPWVLAGLGAVAMFGSLVGEWQVVGNQWVGIGRTLVWGVAWLVGAMLLATSAGLTLAGPAPIRQHARAIGLILAGVLFGVLVAGLVSLDQESVYSGFGENVDLSVGRGAYAAFASVLLIGAALYLAPVEAAPPPATEAEVSDGPADLAVGPAEPMLRPTDTLQG